MAEKIDGYQNGINAVEQNLKALDPEHQAGYTKFADTQRKLVAGNNEHEDRLDSIEQALAGRPF